MDDAEDQKLAPQFTIRRMLIWTSLLALLFAIAAMAVRGSSFALAVTWTFILLAASLVTYSTMFMLASGIANGFRGLRMSNVSALKDSDSPFAEHRPPPQMIRPEEPN